MLHQSIYVKSKSSIEGCGLFTSTFIEARTILWKLTGNLYTMNEISQWPIERKKLFDIYGFQCDEDLFSLPDGPDKFANHSCLPNAIWHSNTELMASCDIAVGEEITYDYSTCDIDLSFKMKCNCGSANCRGTITNNDYKSLSWQRQYRDNLPDHVLRRIKISRYWP